MPIAMIIFIIGGTITAIMWILNQYNNDDNRITIEEREILLNRLVQDLRREKLHLITQLVDMERYYKLAHQFDAENLRLRHLATRYRRHWIRQSRRRYRPFIRAYHYKTDEWHMKAYNHRTLGWASLRDIRADTKRIWQYGSRFMKARTTNETLPANDTQRTDV